MVMAGLPTPILALTIAVVSFAQPQTRSTGIPAMRMADGRLWTTANLAFKTAQSFCYDNAERNCQKYGRLYTWQAAQQVCRSRGPGWRLPSDQEWRQLASHYGGMHDDARDGGKASYRALIGGGSSGFTAMLGGGRSADGRYERLEAHGFYWTASGIDAGNAVFYNFGHGGLALYRQNAGKKAEAFSVRCIRD